MPGGGCEAVSTCRDHPAAELVHIHISNLVLFLHPLNWGALTVHRECSPR